MTSGHEIKVALDSNSLTYLINAANGSWTSTPVVHDEYVALIRLWFYAVERFYVTDTVKNESQAISEPDKKKTHTAFSTDTYWGITSTNRDLVSTRADALKQFHNRPNDCLVLAEAESIGINILLTYDKDFLKLGKRTFSTTKLIKPSEYWVLLNIPHGAQPKTLPTEGNPLAWQSFWRW